MRRVTLAIGLLALAAVLAPRRRKPSLRVLRISRVVADLDRAETFYREALGFRRIGAGPADAALPALLGLPNASMAQIVMQLGGQEIALVRFDPPGAPYPQDSRSDDLWFQHMAIVVNDMDAAYRRLSEAAPEAISTAGPETLPPRNGNVTAFKFRDPDGHPLELIHFPPGQGRESWQGRADGPCLGIDHSALSVARAALSVAFYGHLGFVVADRSFNHGAAQSRLDGLSNARAQVIGLRPPSADGPGLELLAYQPPGRSAAPAAANARLTDWVTLLVPEPRAPETSARGEPSRVCRDPDGHILLLVDRL